MKNKLLKDLKFNYQLWKTHRMKLKWLNKSIDVIKSCIHIIHHLPFPRSDDDIILVKKAFEEYDNTLRKLEEGIVNESRKRFDIILKNCIITEDCIFKVGDMVRIVNSTDYHKINTVGEIIKVNQSDLTCGVMSEKRGTVITWYNINDLEHIGRYK